MPKGLELAGKLMQNTPRVVQILLGPIKPREDTARPQFITLKPQSPRLATKKNQYGRVRAAANRKASIVENDIQ
jgi:hypothetical protein